MDGLRLHKARQGFKDAGHLGYKFLNWRKVLKKQNEYQEKEVPGAMQRMDVVHPHKYKLGNKQLYDIFV